MNEAADAGAAAKIGKPMTKRPAQVRKCDSSMQQQLPPSRIKENSSGLVLISKHQTSMIENAK
jgi:hypothetical protein